MPKKLSVLSLAALLSVGVANAQTTINSNSGLTGTVNANVSAIASSTTDTSATSTATSTNNTGNNGNNNSGNNATTTDNNNASSTNSGNNNNASSTNNGNSNNTSTSTATSTEVGVLREQLQVLRDQLTSLQQQFANIWARLQIFIGGGSDNNGNGNGTSTPSTSAAIEPMRATIMGGGVIDWKGTNFGHEQNIKVMLNGQVVGSAHADSGGNFTTGSMRVPTTPGVYTYSFEGENSGNVNSQITVI